MINTAGVYAMLAAVAEQELRAPRDFELEMRCRHGTAAATLRMTEKREAPCASVADARCRRLHDARCRERAG